MNRRLLTALLAVVALTTHAAQHEPYNSSRIFWDTATRKTICNGGYGRLIELQDGRYMATSESGGIVIAFSSDKGATWGSATKIVTNSNNTPNCVPDLIQLRDGTIIVAYNPRPSTPYTEDRKFGIRCKRSTDNGKTWSSEIWVNDASYTSADGCWEPSMVELPSGELQLYFADEGPFTSSGEQQISLCRSFDGGQTWQKAERVSFRAGFRDGMPVPILLNDGKTIVVAIEDNGWSGYGSFIPTTVRCPIETNWNNYWVNATSSNRDRSVNYGFCNTAIGGAPYLRQLPWGETILSHQSDLGPGKNQMYVYVGNDEAKDFKAMSQPFGVIGDNDSFLWNSLAVVDTGTVVAVGGNAGHIEMIKGYAVRKLFAPYASKISVDGNQTSGEGYYKRMATQIILGQENGVRFTGDFAYDRDSLYFTSRVSDRTQQDIAGINTDGMNLYLDLDNRCETAPVTGVYRLFFKLDGTMETYYGLDERKRWNVGTTDDIHYALQLKSTYYIVEVAIPWSFFGLDVAPVGKEMRAMIELWDRRSESDATLYKETFPDGKVAASWTYMPFELLDSEEMGVPLLRTSGNSSKKSAYKGMLFDLQGRRLNSVPDHGIYIQDGQKRMKKEK